MHFQMADQLNRLESTLRGWQEGKIQELIPARILHTRILSLFVSQNLIRHKQVLLDLAVWLEVDRSSVTHLIADRSLPVLAILVEETRKIGVVPGMSGVSDRLYRLWEIALVVSASSLVRNEFLREAEVLRRLLMKGL